MKKLIAVLCAVTMLAATCVTSFAAGSITSATALGNGGKASNVSAIGITLPAEGLVAKAPKASALPADSAAAKFLAAYEAGKNFEECLAAADVTDKLTTEGGKTVDPKTAKQLTEPFAFCNAVTGELLEGDGKMKATLTGNENTKGKSSDNMAIVVLSTKDASVSAIDLTADSAANTFTAIYPTLGVNVVAGI